MLLNRYCLGSLILFDVPSSYCTRSMADVSADGASLQAHLGVRLDSIGVSKLKILRVGRTYTKHLGIVPRRRSHCFICLSYVLRLLGLHRVKCRQESPPARRSILDPHQGLL